MARKNKKNNDWNGMVYSTDPDYEFDQGDEGNKESVPPERQSLRIQLVRLKGNKVVTQVYDFIGPDDDFKDLGKQLKSKCGCGGSVKEGKILLQGDFREKVKTELTRLGYKYKQVGG